MKNLPLGQVLVEAGFLTPEKLDEALALQKEKGGRLGDLLVENGYVTEHNLMLALQQRLEVPFVDLQEERIDRAAVQLVPRELAQKYSLIPLRVQGGELTVATNNPLDFYAFGELGLVTGMQIVPVLATKRDLNDAIHRCYAQQGAESALEEFNREYEDVADPARGEDYSDMLERVESAPVVRLLNSIVAQAYHMRASDIHVEPGKQNVSVRFRVDGELIEAMLLNSSVHVSLITRLKILSGIDIGERRVPQDGPLLRRRGRQGGQPARFHPAHRLRRKSGAAHHGGQHPRHRRRAGHRHLGGQLRAPGGSDAQPQRDHPRDGPDGQRQVDHDLRGPPPALDAERERRDDRGPGGKAGRRHQPGADQPEGGAHLRLRPALDPPAGPGCHHDR